MSAMETLRDRFAMAALTGLLADHENEGPAEEFAESAYKFADAMMDHRERNPAEGR